MIGEIVDTLPLIGIIGWLIRVALFVGMGTGSAYLLMNSQGWPAMVAPVSTGVYLIWISLTGVSGAIVVPGLCFTALVWSFVWHLLQSDKHPLERGVQRGK